MSASSSIAADYGGQPELNTRTKGGGQQDRVARGLALRVGTRDLDGRGSSRVRNCGFMERLYWLNVSVSTDGH